MTLAILCSLKSVESLENTLQPHSGGTPLFSMKTESRATSQGCRSVDADAWCKWALIRYVLPPSRQCVMSCCFCLVKCACFLLVDSVTETTLLARKIFPCSSSKRGVNVRFSDGKSMVSDTSDVRANNPRHTSFKTYLWQICLHSNLPIVTI